MKGGKPGSLARLLEENPELSVAEGGRGELQHGTVGACSPMGVCTGWTGTLSLGEPVAQLEEQVETREGGEAGWGPAFPTKVYT